LVQRCCLRRRGGTTWGSITGTLSNQTDLQSELNAKYDASNPAGYIDSSALSPYLTSATAASTYYPLTNPSGYISGIVSSDVTTALGYTPVPDTRTLTINGTSYDLTADRSWTVSSAPASGTIILLYTDETDANGSGTVLSVKGYSVPSNTYSLIMTEAEVSFNGAANADNELAYRLMDGTTTLREFRLKQDATGNGDTWILGGSLKYSLPFTSGGLLDIDVVVINGAGFTWTVHSFRVFGVV